MIDRIYIDNLGPFVNFEWRPGRLALLMGANGSGKTNLADALATIRAFATGEKSVAEAFPATSRTRWDTRAIQTIALDVPTTHGHCTYELTLGGETTGHHGPVLAREVLAVDGQSIIEFGASGLQVRRGDKMVSVPGAKPTRSGVGAMDLAEVPAHAAFLSALSDLWLVAPNPPMMSGTINRAKTAGIPWLSTNLQTFAAWYPAMLTAKPGAVFRAIRDLGGCLPGLSELFNDQGTLSARFEIDGVTTTFAFDELSDGQRVLIALYVLLHTIAVTGKTLILDEPDNYLALREVQPFLAELTDRALRTDGPQVFVISHHPDVLNFLAVEHGWRMFRENGGPTRIERFQVAPGLDAAETHARGWDEKP